MKKLYKQLKENYKTLTVVLISGILLGILFSGLTGKQAKNDESVENYTDHDHESELPELWTCSMHPQIKQDEPGDCPICGMDLIPLQTMSSGTNQVDPDEIMFTEAAAALAEIQTTQVVRKKPEKELYLQGIVEADERNISQLSARFNGRIEKLHVNYTGEIVRRGQLLATIYSPELVTAQKELLEAIDLKEDRPSIYQAARSRLKLWDITEGQIDEILEKGEPLLYFDILSPITGTVMERHITEGEYVKTGDKMLEITDLTRIWVMFDAYEEDLEWVNSGDRMKINLQSLPGKSFYGKVEYIDPFIDVKARTAGIRVELDNYTMELKPGMFAEGVLTSAIAGDTERLLVPKSSVLWTGKRSVVYVKVTERETPSFLYREIKLGPEAGDHYVVADGLEEGEEIVINGVFKVDAAAQLEGKRSMMNPERVTLSSVHDHNDMIMDSAGNMKDLENMATGRYGTSSLFRDQLTVLYDAYIDMKNAFVDTDAQKVSSLAGSALVTLARVDMGMLKGDSLIQWMDNRKVLENLFKVISESDDIKKQREAFLALNNIFYLTVKTFGLNRDTVYYQYCPMADNDRGGYWLSNEKEIRNPYFGDMMLKCGEVKETITKNDEGDFKK